MEYEKIMKNKKVRFVMTDEELKILLEIWRKKR